MMATMLHGETPFPSWFASRFIVNTWRPFSFFVFRTESFISIVGSGLDLTGPIQKLANSEVTTRTRAFWDWSSCTFPCCIWHLRGRAFALCSFSCTFSLLIPRRVLTSHTYPWLYLGKKKCAWEMTLITFLKW